MEQGFPLRVFSRFPPSLTGGPVSLYENDRAPSAREALGVLSFS